MKKARFLCDRLLFVSGLALTVLMSILSICFGVGSLTGWVPTESHGDAVGVAVVFFLMLLLFYIAIVMSLPRIATIVEFTPESVTLWIPLQKRITHPYKHYAHIYRGTYFHGNIFGMGFEVSYIVFSASYLKNEILNQVNQLGNAPDAFKIRYNKRTMKKLESVLPLRQCVELKNAFQISK